MADDFYVYVYIDPRNFEEFYYGKGKGDRMLAHLDDTSDSEKTRRIEAIRAARQEPIIRVIARGLTEDEAFMVETTLIWKLGRSLTNIASGKFVGRFRPKDTMHERLAHFDIANGVYYVNVGEGVERNWDDCRRFGFLAAGGHPKWSDQIRALEAGDIVAAYLTGLGYVGVGRVETPAVPYNMFRHQGRELAALDIREPGIAHDSADLSLCEYIVAVDWVTTVPRGEAKKFPKREGLFAPQRVRASLDSQPRTVEFIDKEFGVSLYDLRPERSL